MSEKRKLVATFTDWELVVMARALRLRETVEKLRDEELKRFRENEDMSDYMAKKAFWEIRTAFDNLLKKLKSLEEW